MASIADQPELQAAADKANLSSARWTMLLPIVFIMYTISFFDRSNFGIAMPYIIQELHITKTQAGFAAGVFNWGYIVTQLTAGFLVLKFGFRGVVGASLILWGLTALATAFTNSFAELVTYRILLGLFEGPVFAATSGLLAQWFMKRERGRAFGIWNLSSPLGGFLAGPISGYILAHYDWRWMMIAEALPALIWAALWWWRIPKSMEQASWLSSSERAYIKSELQKEAVDLQKKDSASIWSVLSEPAVWLTFFGFACITLLLGGYVTWLPSALKAMPGMSIETVGWLSGIPFIAAMFGMFFITRHSDKHGQERRWHSAIPCMVTGVLLIIAGLTPARMYVFEIAVLIVMGFTMKMFLPLIFTRLTELLPSEKAVTAVGLVNGMANLFGGFIGPVLIGYLASTSFGFGASFVALGISGIVGGILFASLRAK